MARCNRCNKFMFKSSVSGYCDECKYLVWKEAQEKQKEAEQKLLEEQRKQKELECKKAQREQFEKEQLERRRKNEVKQKQLEEQRKKEIKWEDFSFNIRCPVCGKNSYTNAFANSKSVFACKTGRDIGQPCTGRICFCKECNSYYPESGFGKHGDVYECKECGRVQWELTELKEKDAQMIAMLNRFRASF